MDAYKVEKRLNAIQKSLKDTDYQNAKKRDVRSQSILKQTGQHLTLLMMTN